MGDLSSLGLLALLKGNFDIVIALPSKVSDELEVKIFWILVRDQPEIYLAKPSPGRAVFEPGPVCVCVCACAGD